VRWPPAWELVDWINSSVVGYSPENNDGSTEAENSPLLKAVIRERLVKTQQTEKS
jgi:hypothetical protein